MSETQYQFEVGQKVRFADVEEIKPEYRGLEVAIERRFEDGNALLNAIAEEKGVEVPPLPVWAMLSGFTPDQAYGPMYVVRLPDMDPDANVPLTFHQPEDRFEAVQ